MNEGNSETPFQSKFRSCYLSGQVRKSNLKDAERLKCILGVMICNVDNGICSSQHCMEVNTQQQTHNNTMAKNENTAPVKVEFKIKSGMPIPPKASRPSRYKEALKGMKVGDAIEVPGKTASYIRILMRSLGWKTREGVDSKSGKRHVWRIS